MPHHTVRVRARNYHEYMQVLKGIFHLGDRELDVLESLHRLSSNYLVTKKTRKLVEKDLGIQINNYISKLKLKGALLLDEETGLYMINHLARYSDEIDGIYFMLKKDE